MALEIETFSNVSGGSSFFKAIGHPLAARRVPALLERLRGRPVALYDPYGFAAAFAELYDLCGLELAGVYVQDVNELGSSRLGRAVQPVTDLAAAESDAVLVMAFDAGRPTQHIRHLIPEGAAVESLDALRLPDDMLSDRRRYLSGLNFATNFVFFRDQDGHHTRLTTANYWSLYGAEAPALWCCLFDAAGGVLAEWRDPLPAAEAAVVIDSAEIRRRFELPAFTGQLFVHVVGAAGHDTVKYALDTYGDSDAVLSATHDANAWPAALYAGLPAPGPGERVLLWIQNSHPVTVPPGAISLNLMGRAETRALAESLAPFATRALDTRELFPEAAWPEQFEVGAGKHMVRPRYEVLGVGGRRRIAHVNVERTDLKPDPRIPELANLMGKGYLLPAPLLPAADFSASSSASLRESMNRNASRPMVSASSRLRKVVIGGSSSRRLPSPSVNLRPVASSNACREQPSTLPE